MLLSSVSDLPPTPHGQGPLHEHKLENGETFTHHNPHVPIHDHGVSFYIQFAVCRAKVGLKYWFCINHHSELDL